MCPHSTLVGAIPLWVVQHGGAFIPHHTAAASLAPSPIPPTSSISPAPMAHLVCPPPLSHLVRFPRSLHQLEDEWLWSLTDTEVIGVTYGVVVLAVVVRDVECTGGDPCVAPGGGNGREGMNLQIYLSTWLQGESVKMCEQRGTSTLNAHPTTHLGCPDWCT